MEYIYLACAVVDSPQFLGSEPCDRATWLCLIRFCVGQENSGKMPDCREWSDRRWQQIAAVTKAEVERPCDLWRWEGKSLVVWGYPKAQEELHQKRRKYGKAGAKTRWNGNGLNYPKPPSRGGSQPDPPESRPTDCDPEI